MFSPFNFGFDHLVGPVYGVDGKDKGGDLLFSNNFLLSPVANRINVIDLRNNRTRTLACENRRYVSAA